VLSDLPREGRVAAPPQQPAFLGGHTNIFQLTMIPVPPLSVKFPDDERARLKALADKIGWSEGQVVRDSVAHVLNLIYRAEPDAPAPKLITLSQLALFHEENPDLLQRHVKKSHLNTLPVKSGPGGK
jgi:hypothetical protein